MGTPTQSASKAAGVIGLGIMGSAMARNLRRAGFKVNIYNRTRAKVEELTREGLFPFSTPAELSQASDVILTMVSDPVALRAVAHGPNGIFSEPGGGKTLIQLGTMDVETTLKLAEDAERAGYRFLDSPVTGSKKQVEAAELILEIGGEAALIEEMKPVLLAIGRHIVHAGKIGAGTSLKLCMNLIVAQMTTGLCEAVALARSQGIDPGHIFEVLAQSPALNCIYYTIKKTPLISRNYPPAFSLANMLKDVRFMNEEAQKKGLRLPVNSAVQSLLEAALKQGYADRDLSVIAEVLK